MPLVRVATVAPQLWVTACPFAQVQATDQPLVADPPLVIFTSAWKPPLHWLVTLYVARHAPPGLSVVGGLVGVGLAGDGVEVGVTDSDGDGFGLPVPPKTTSL